MKIPEKGSPGDPWPHLGPILICDASYVDGWWQDIKRSLERGLVQHLPLTPRNGDQDRVYVFSEKRKMFRRPYILGVYQYTGGRINKYNFRTVTP